MPSTAPSETGLITLHAGERAARRGKHREHRHERGPDGGCPCFPQGAASASRKGSVAGLAPHAYRRIDRDGRSRADRHNRSRPWLAAALGGRRRAQRTCQPASRRRRHPRRSVPAARTDAPLYRAGQARRDSPGSPRCRLSPSGQPRLQYQRHVRHGQTARAGDHHSPATNGPTRPALPSAQAARVTTNHAAAPSRPGRTLTARQVSQGESRSVLPGQPVPSSPRFGPEPSRPAGLFGAEA